MEEKKIEEMTEKEMLRQQLELLAKVSKDTADEILPQLSESMCQIYSLIERPSIFSNYLPKEEKELDPKIDDIKAMLIESTCRSNNILTAMNSFLSYQKNLLDFLFDKLQIEKPEPEKYDFGASIRNNQQEK